MSWEQEILDLSFPADEDLTQDTYKFVVLAADGGVRKPISATETALGILQEGCPQGGGAAVRIMGVSKLRANGALGIGTFVSPEFIAAGNAGRGQNSGGAPQYTRGQVLFPTANADELASVLLAPSFPAINTSVANVKEAASYSTAGPQTYTAGDFIGGMILRSIAAAQNDVTPAAAQLVAAIAGCIVGSSFRVVIRNTAAGAYAITLTAGAGVTISGTATIGQNASKEFLAIVTDATPGAEAVTLYSLGTSVF